MRDTKKTFLEIVALAMSNPKEFEKRMKEMDSEELMEYEGERICWLEEQEIPRKEKRLH